MRDRQGQANMERALAAQKASEDAEMTDVNPNLIALGVKQEVKVRSLDTWRGRRGSWAYAVGKLRINVGDDVIKH